MLGAVGENPMEEVKLAFDAGGAYVVSTGRSDHRRKFWKVALGQVQQHPKKNHPGH